MRLYNRRKIIRFLTLHVCFPAFIGLFDISSSTHLPMFQCSFAGSSHTRAWWVGCLSPTPKACITTFGSWQPRRLRFRHGADAAKGLQQDHYHQLSSHFESRMHTLIHKAPHLLAST